MVAPVRASAAVAACVLSACRPSAAFSSMRPVQDYAKPVATYSRPGPSLQMTADRDGEASAASGASPPSSSFRRTFLASASAMLVGIATGPIAALAEEEQGSAAEPRASLDSSLYQILRVKEATQQEQRLIKSGKFKDLQRANVKLAVRYILNNYRLSDSLVVASASLEGNRRIKAGEVGQRVVQDLYTILEYFDSSDVDNLKVGNLNNMTGKESIVNSGLATVSRGLEEFLSFFPDGVVESVKARIQEENDLNMKEFDTNLGAILNPSPKL